MSEDIRYNNYQIIEYKPNKWSYNWSQFAGIPYIPLITEWEEWVFRTIKEDTLHEFMQQKWHYSGYISIIYIALIPVLKKWMSIRGKGYNLRKLLAFWNSTLAVFSIIGVVRCLPEFIDILWTKGFTASFCESTYYTDSRLNWWYILFVWSKVLELIDTLFIIARNGKLLTLHWVHHCLTLIYSWYVFGDVPATARWMVNMNFIAHSLMYTYYALKAMRISIPLVISISITLIQILQMIFGLYINYIVINYKNSGIPCDCSKSVAVTGLSLYTLFFVLFVNFFIQTYLVKNGQKINFSKRMSISMPNVKTKSSDNNNTVDENHNKFNEIYFNIKRN